MNPNISQRELASKLGFSLGETNYCMKSLRAKGFIKIKILRKIRKIKLYIFINTTRIAHKAKLTVNFMKLKMTEYDELKKDMED